uniref:Uncharacterized protein n=1 Tax=Arundo donax TaxID=35708 RepID=A0A0A9H740_ARUDO
MEKLCVSWFILH